MIGSQQAFLFEKKKTSGHEMFQYLHVIVSC